MQKHLRLIALLALTLVTVVGGRAQTTTAAPAVAPQVAGEEEVTPIELEMQKVVDSVRTKIKAGVRTEAALADEIKGFDAILAAHKGEHPEQLSLVLLMKGMLYVEVLKDFDKGEAVIRQLKAEFPNTPAGSRADSMLAAVAQQKESMKVQAALAPGAAFPNFEEKDLSGQPLSVAKYKLQG